MVKGETERKIEKIETETRREIDRHIETDQRSRKKCVKERKPNLDNEN